MEARPRVKDAFPRLAIGSAYDPAPALLRAGGGRRGLVHGGGPAPPRRAAVALAADPRPRGGARREAARATAAAGPPDRRRPRVRRRSAPGCEHGVNELRVATVRSLAVSQLPAAIRRWRTTHPGMTVHLNEYAHREIAGRSVLDGESELGIAPRPLDWS